MIKVAVRPSEFRPLWRALRSRGVQMTRQPGKAVMSHVVPDSSPVGFLKNLLTGKATRPYEQLNVPRGYESPVGTWLHEAGHGLDPGYATKLHGPRASLTDEVLANRNVHRALSPESYEKIRPSLQKSFKSYGIGTPFVAARRATPEVAPLWEAAVGRGKELGFNDQASLTKAVRRQMARRSPEFEAQFKDQAFNLQDLLKQKP